MENEINKFDNFLKESVDQAQFPFKEDYWSQMSEMLDEEDKRKKRPLFWRGFSIFVGLLLLSIGAFLYPKLKSNKYPNASTKQELVLANEQMPSVNQDAPIEAEQTLQESNKKQTDKISNEEQVEISPNSSSKSISQSSSNNDDVQSQIDKKQPHNDNNSINTKAKGSQQQLVSSRIKDVSSQSQSNSTQTLKDISPESSVVNVQNSSDVSLSNGQSNDRKINANSKKSSLQLLKSKKIKSTTASLDSKSTKPSPANVDQNSIAKDDAQILTASIQNDKQTLTNIHGKMMLKDDSVNLKGRQAIDVAISNPRYMASLKNYIPEYIDNVTILSYKPVEKNEPIEEKSDLPIKPEIAKTKSFEPKPFEFFMLAGFNANKGFKGNVASPISWGLSPYVGLGLDKPLSDRITMSSHVGFTYFNGLNLTEKSSVVNYSFGVDSANIVVSHKKLFQTYLPVSLYYQVLRNHYLMSSFGASYSLDVSSKVQTGGNTQSQTGYRSGFNALDLFASLGYSYRISDKLMIQLAFQQGFMNMTKSEHFNQKNTQQRFQVGIKYNFKRNDN